MSNTSIELGELYVFPSIDKDTFVELMGALILNYVPKGCNTVFIEMRGRNDTVSFNIDKDEEFKNVGDISYYIHIIEDKKVKSQYFDTKLYFKEDNTMFLESDFYAKYKKELMEVLEDTEYVDDPLEFITNFQLYFYEAKLNIDGKQYLDVVAALGSKEEFVSDFILAYQYFLKVVSRIILNLHYNIHSIHNKEELVRFIISHFDGSFPRFQSV